MNLKYIKISTFVLLFFSFFAPLGVVALFNLDEGAFGEATREMVASGNYLTTYLNGELRFDKPILIYWFQSLSVRFLGLVNLPLDFHLLFLLHFGDWQYFISHENILMNKKHF